MIPQASILVLLGDQMIDTITLLKLCKWAPSGGNTQPWSITIDEQTKTSLTLSISLTEECEKDDLLMEAYGSGAIYSLGTLAYTVKKVMNCAGWKTTEDSFITSENAYKCKATIKFKLVQNATCTIEEIESILKSRKSNRYLYKTQPLPQHVKEKLINISHKYSNLELIINEKNKNKIASILSPLENIRCQNQKVSKEFLNEIHFKPTNSGLPSNTLGQPFWSLMTMRMWKRFSWIRYQFHIGAQYLFRYLAVTRPIRNSSALITIQSSILNFESIYQIGQCLCESWFMLDNEKQSVQIFGLPIFSLLSLIHPNARQILSTNETQLILNAQEKLKNYNININKPCIMFRCGLAEKEAVLTPRKEIQISIKNNIAKSNNQSLLETL